MAGEAVIILLLLFITGGQSTVTFNYENRCTESIWLGATPSIGNSDPEFTSGTSKTLQMPDQWKGFIWGRTKCSLNASNYFSCETGDCGGNKICQWPVPNSPVTILNFTINQPVQTNPLVVSYELNLNHGHNVPVRIQPVGGSLVGGGTGPCPVVDCAQDFSNVCPPNLVAKGEGGRYVGCLSACDALKDPKYCCFGKFASPQTCQPNEYSSIFKKACGLAHTYPGDNQPPIYSCSEATSFSITFCPATTRKTSYCGGPIAAGAKTAAICRLLRRIFGPSLYMRPIAAFYMPAAIVLVFCGVLQRRVIGPPQ